ncbi:hypothetical protein GCM10010981_38970 [Dyella nitratireducens]|uniref:DUF4276 family protein n=1 Tax=Dyella nitratireducens TaxID=1849580 RepID=A0ABQ1GLM4_9GAMM|nr:hypothetical protein GCM10010981_38970 [Dyella nitratireducens]GLQ41398.1 hypothetical protein GCM10007902_12480 [Dyella nitratireducens]
MVDVIVFAEGQSEEQFIKQVVAPSLHHQQIYLKAQTLKTSQQGTGGAVTFGRLMFYARNALRQYPNAILTTFLDLYGLDTDFPEFHEAKKQAEVAGRVAKLEAALHREVVTQVGCRAERFIPHIQPYEFEGLLFSDVTALSTIEPRWKRYLNQLRVIRDAFPTPEHINDSFETKPSRRLEALLEPQYRKTRHGPLVAGRVTLATMESECLHFRGWIEKLRALV